MSVLFDLIYAVALLVGWPLLLWRRVRRGPGSISLRERLGDVPSRPVAGACVWIHGVSLGEINATRTIVEQLRQRSPETAIAVSSTTETGLTRARQLYQRLTVFRFPLDFSFVLRRVIDRIRPSVIVLMELELWPNLLEVARREGIPVIIANGRLTEERTMRWLRRWPLSWLARRMLRQVAWIGAQDETYARRFIELGADPRRVEVCGSLKYDAALIADRVEGQDALAEQMTIDRARPLWVCGSTGPGEEALLLDAYERLLPAHPALQLAIVPRKPERFDEVAQLIARRGFACLRRSGKPPVVPPDVSEPRPVFLGDTMGELRKFYALATVVFVGRSLVPMGGSDVMEAAALGKPLLFGPHTTNFAEPVALLLEHKAAVQVADVEALVGQIDDLLRHPKKRQVIGRRGQSVIAGRRGATQRTVERILELCAASDSATDEPLRTT